MLPTQYLEPKCRPRIVDVPAARIAVILCILGSSCAYQRVPMQATVPVSEELLDDLRQRALAHNQALVVHGVRNYTIYLEAENEARAVLGRYNRRLSILDAMSALQDGLDITTGSIGVGLAVLNAVNTRNNRPIDPNEKNVSNPGEDRNWFSRNISRIAFVTGVVHLVHYLMGGNERTKVIGTAAAVTECVIEAARPSIHRIKIARATLPELKKRKKAEEKGRSPSLDRASTGVFGRAMKDYIRTKLAADYEGAQAAALLRSAIAKIQASVTAQISGADLGEAKSLMSEPTDIDSFAGQRVQQCLTRLPLSVGGQ